MIFIHRNCPITSKVFTSNTDISFEIYLVCIVSMSMWPYLEAVSWSDLCVILILQYCIPSNNVLYRTSSKNAVFWLVVSTDTAMTHWLMCHAIHVANSNICYCHTLCTRPFVYISIFLFFQWCIINLEDKM